MLAGLCLTGCSSYDEVGAQLTSIEVTVQRIEGKLEALEERPAGSEPVAAATPESSPGLVDLQTSLLRIEQRLKELEARLSRRSPEPTEGDAVDTKPGPLPRAGQTLQVLSTGGGGLLLVRVGKTPQRLRLVGVDAPQRRYELAPERRELHRTSFRKELSAEKAWESSKWKLGEYLTGATVRVAPGTRPVWREDAIVARVEIVGKDGKAKDLGALMIRSGYALAAGDHDQADAYKAMEKAARAEGAGLLRPAGD